MGQGIAYEPAVQSVLRGLHSRISRVHHPTEVACHPDSDMHHMQILASFEAPKFRSEGRSRQWPRSRYGPCPSAPTLRVGTSVSKSYISAGSPALLGARAARWPGCAFLHARICSRRESDGNGRCTNVRRATGITRFHKI